MKLKLTKLEKYWILYDVGNSAFVLLVSVVSQISGDVSKGVGMIAVLFVVGILFFRQAVRYKK